MTTTEPCGDCGSARQVTRGKQPANDSPSGAIAFERWDPCPNPACPTSKAARGIPEFYGVAHVTINVSDLDRSVTWYRDVLGFDEPWLAVDDRVALLFHPESKLEVVLRQGRVPTGDAGEPVFHVAFRVEDVEQLRVWERHLARYGVDAHVTRAVGGVNIDLADPDGNDLELFAYDPPRAAC